MEQLRLDLSLICRLSGSVLPRALVWALPSSLLAVVLQILFQE